MNLMASWRPAQVRLAPQVGQTGQNVAYVPPPPKTAFIDSALLAAALDATIVAGAGLNAIANHREMKDEPGDKRKASLKRKSYFFWGIAGLAGLKGALDVSRLNSDAGPTSGFEQTMASPGMALATDLASAGVAALVAYGYQMKKNDTLRNWASFWWVVTTVAVVKGLHDYKRATS